MAPPPVAGREGGLEGVKNGVPEGGVAGFGEVDAVRVPERVAVPPALFRVRAGPAV